MAKAIKEHRDNQEVKLSFKGSFDDVIKASVLAGRKGQIKKAAVKKPAKKK